MSAVEIRRGQLKNGSGAAGEGKRGGPPLHIGLAGALGVINLSLAEQDMPCLSKQCRSRSVGF